MVQDAQRALLVALLVLVPAVVGGCLTDEEPNAPRVSNATDQPVELFVIANGIPTQISTIDSGVTVDLGIFGDQCTGEVLVARLGSGAEVDRLVEPLCPEETWVIGQ
jgi:hypothetical protein